MPGFRFDNAAVRAVIGQQRRGDDWEASPLFYRAPRPAATRAASTTFFGMRYRSAISASIFAPSTGLQAALFRPGAAQSQPRDRVRRVGALMGLAADDAELQARLAALAQVLNKRAAVWQHLGTITRANAALAQARSGFGRTRP